MFMNLGHSKPRIKIGGGNAILTTSRILRDRRRGYLSRRYLHPGQRPEEHRLSRRLQIWRGHVIEEFVSGNPQARSDTYGTDCYPRKRIEDYINKETVNEAYIYSPRNSYQNYNVGSTSPTGSSTRTWE
jgi:hypothetical protein